MTYVIAREIQRFQKWGSQSFAGHEVTSICDYGWLLHPKSPAKSCTLPAQKSVALTLTGLIHGVESAGVAVLNETLTHLAAGGVEACMPLAFILGNPWAAQKEQRFIDKDLNRSFGATGLTDAEGRAIFELKRAKDLEPTLAQSTYILDFHQTTRASDRPFFIFPYSAASFQWARRIAPRITVVTHWGKPFSSEGRCSDEYVNGCGGIGITMELGQNGLDTYQIAAGVEAALWSIRAVQANLQGATGKLRAVDDAEQGEIFTWGQIVPWPAVGLVDLRPDWHNFKMVQAGESLGTVDGKPLVAETSGRILFPKYLSHAEQRVLVSRPTELCRIMKNINVSDLPTA